MKYSQKLTHSGYYFETNWHQKEWEILTKMEAPIIPPWCGADCLSCSFRLFYAWLKLINCHKKMLMEVPA